MPALRLRLSAGAPVFCTYERENAGKPLRNQYVNLALKRAAARAGIEKRVHPHSLRHTFAFDLRREGRDLPTISEALGHNDFGTTQRYISHLAPLERIEILNQRAWPASVAASTERRDATARRTTTATAAAAGAAPTAPTPA